jgi:hypothetical protein
LEQVVAVRFFVRLAARAMAATPGIGGSRHNLLNANYKAMGTVTATLASGGERKKLLAAIVSTDGECTNSTHVAPSVGLCPVLSLPAVMSSRQLPS